MSAAQRQKQQGAVLIMALLIVALVASLAVSFAGRFQLHTARAENQLHGAQARAFVLGAESLALSVLQQDRQDSEVDHLDEDWARKIQPFSVDGGWLRAELEDAQGRFNLNSLAHTSDWFDRPELASDDPRRFTEAQRRFLRLLQTFEDEALSLDEAVSLLEAIVDWLDADDDESGFGGAESLYYNAQESAYGAANRAFMSVSELRLVRHMDESLYRVLQPLLVALPTEAGLNINTMPLALWRTLQAQTSLEPLALSDAEQLLESRQAGAYVSVEKFVSSEVLRDVLPADGKLNDVGLTVSSDYFWLQAEAAVVNQRRRLHSLLWRDGELLRSIRRTDV